MIALEWKKNPIILIKIYIKYCFLRTYLIEKVNNEIANNCLNKVNSCQKKAL